MRSLSTHSTQGGPMRELTKAELRIIKELKKQDILQPPRGYQLDYRNGVIMVACADGDQLYDLFTTHAGLCPSNPNRHRIHLLTRNGGALWISRPRTFNRQTDEVGSLLKEIQKAHSMKHINAVALYTHVPCGVADEFNTDIVTNLKLLIEAKILVRPLSPDFQTAEFFHVDYGQGKKRSYYVSPEKFDEWLNSKKS